MKSIPAIMLLLFAGTTPAQDWQWSKQIGGPGPDGGYIGALDALGQVYVYGNYANPLGPTTFSECYFEDDTLTGSNEAFIAKYTADGTLAWARTISSPGDAYIGAMVLDTLNGCFYITGSYENSCVLDTCTLNAPGAGAVLAKWNTDGHCLWARNIATSGSSVLGSTTGLGIAQVANGDLIISLKTDRFGTTVAGTQAMQSGAFLVKYDQDGNELWVKQFATYNETEKYIHLYTLRYHDGRIFGHGPVAITPEADTTTVDTIQIIGRQGEGYALTSIDPATGFAEWFRLDGFPNGWVNVQGMEIDDQSGIFVGGSYSPLAIFGLDTLTSGNGYRKGFLAQYDFNGSLGFVRQFEGSSGFGFAGITTSDAGIIALSGVFDGQVEFGGVTYSAATSSDVFVSLHDSAGNPIGLIQAGYGSGYSVRMDADAIMVCGSFPGPLMPTGSTTIGSDTHESHGYEDIFIAKHGMITSTPQSMVLEDTGLEIYANPNRGSFRLKVPRALGNEPQLQLRIYDGTGRMVSEQQLIMDEERPRLDVWDVSPGFYMVTLSNGKRTYSGNMVVE